MNDRRRDKAAEYRQQAAEIRTMSRQISLSDSRNQLLETARRLEALAEAEDRKVQRAACGFDPASDA